MNYSLPPYQPQSSPPFDSYACTNEAFINCVEMVRGNFQEFSVSGSAVQSGTRPGVGNDLTHVIYIANQQGLISYASRPLPPVFNQSEYLAPLTATQLATANKSMQFTLVSPDLKISPIILHLNLGGVGHLALTIDMVNMIDGYAPQVKPINWAQVLDQHSLLITNKMLTFGYQVAGAPTIYVQVGNSLVPLATWQAFINIGGSTTSIVNITQQQLDASSVIGNDYFTSK